MAGLPRYEAIVSEVLETNEKHNFQAVKLEFNGLSVVRYLDGTSLKAGDVGEATGNGEVGKFFFQNKIWKIDRPSLAERDFYGWKPDW